MKNLKYTILLLAAFIFTSCYYSAPSQEQTQNTEQENYQDETLAEPQETEQKESEEAENKGDKNLTESTDKLEIPVMNKEIPEIYLERKGFTVSFNPETNIPNWVGWELNQTKLADVVGRAKHFYTDPDIPEEFAVTTKDYSNSGWDRGHMCPAADNKWDEEAMRQCFYMTNMCPQHHNLNRGDWKELEEKCRKWAEESGTIYIVCGPILYKTGNYIESGHTIRIPDAFFKVVLAGMDENKPRAIGFLYKNTSGNKPLDAYVNSIDQVERITGLDFFSALDDEIENEIEAQYDMSQWQ